MLKWARMMLNINSILEVWRKVGGFFENSHLQNQDDGADWVHFFGMPFMHYQSNKGGPSVCAIFKIRNLSSVLRFPPIKGLPENT